MQREDGRPGCQGKRRRAARGWVALKRALGGLSVYGSVRWPASLWWCWGGKQGSAVPGQVTGVGVTGGVQCSSSAASSRCVESAVSPQSSFSTVAARQARKAAGAEADNRTAERLGGGIELLGNHPRRLEPPSLHATGPVASSQAPSVVGLGENCVMPSLAIAVWALQPPAAPTSRRAHAQSTPNIIYKCINTALPAIFHDRSRVANCGFQVALSPLSVSPCRSFHATPVRAAPSVAPQHVVLIKELQGPTAGLSANFSYLSNICIPATSAAPCCLSRLHIQTSPTAAAR